MARRYPTVAGTLLALVAACAGCASLPQGLIARTAAGAEAFVANFAYESQPGSTVTAVDLQAGRVDASIETHGTLPAAVVVLPGGRRLLVADQGSDRLTLIGLPSGEVLATGTTGLEPDALALAFTPAGTVAVAPDLEAGTLAAALLGVGPHGGPVLRPLPPVTVGAEPDAVAVAPSLLGPVALVANFGSNTVTPVAVMGGGDRVTLHPLPPVSVGREPDAIAVTNGPFGTIALVADYGSNDLAPIALSTKGAGLQSTPLARVALPGAPTDVVVWQGGASIGPAVLVTLKDALVRLSLPALRVVSIADVGAPAEAVAVAPDGTAWVAVQNGRLLAVDLSTDRVVRSVFVGGRPSAVAIG
jgi:DNA-binding beta-propeller fold protein YncE